jgi:uncharacterized phage protein (TIGR01671 family)
MREIKFRAWGVDTLPIGKPMMMAYFTLKDAIYKGGDTCISGWQNDDLIVMPFDDAVIMESTGLKDKNGKEIFEGDIVSFYNASLPKGTRDMFTKNVVKWNARKAQWDGVFSGEVIGNIYENPELLKV